MTLFALLPLHFLLLYFLLAEILNLELESSPLSINHLDKTRMVSISAFVSKGYLNDEVIKMVMDKLDQFSLPSGYRTVFLLIEVEGYTHQDVADLLGVSVGTSKSQLFYAKKRLRELISPKIE